MKVIFRILIVVLSTWGIARGAIYLLPGDPIDYLVNESLIQTSQEKTIEDIRRKMDLNLNFKERLLTLPKGESLTSDKPVMSLLQNALINSTILTLITTLITLLLSTLLLYLGYQSKKWDQAAQFFSVFLASIPIFISGPILLYLFSLKLNFFPVIQHPLLPSICLSLYLTGFWYRSISQKIKKYLPQSAVSGARARGLDEFKIFFFYALAPCSGSLIRFFTSQIGTLLNGSLMVEIIFQWQGLGFLLSDSVLKRDFPVIEITLISVTMVTLISLHLGKWLQMKLEPQQS